jgi:hypothetical protein
MGSTSYYLLCRELSLVTEWAFLCGFAAALPFSLVRLWLTRRQTGGLTAELPLSLMEFSAYYWASVGVLLWRCQAAG